MSIIMALTFLRKIIDFQGPVLITKLLLRNSHQPVSGLQRWKVYWASFNCVSFSALRLVIMIQKDVILLQCAYNSGRKQTFSLYQCQRRHNPSLTYNPNHTHSDSARRGGRSHPCRDPMNCKELRHHRGWKLWIAREVCFLFRLFFSCCSILCPKS